uniref:G protein-coupled receptor kinase 6 n=1 Tax=Lygus hesperus TaxID=30085 RepID=A0A0A9WTB7_LYGHE
MHDHNIVYRDLKPSNILLDEDGNSKISDLGLAIHIHPDRVLRHIAGTAGYWAPEILQRVGTYKTSDYWSFGVVLYEMLVGARPTSTSSKNVGNTSEDLPDDVASAPPPVARPTIDEMNAVHATDVQNNTQQVVNDRGEEFNYNG